MRRILLASALILLVSCGTEDPVHCSEQNNAQEMTKELWVCHNPGHELHGHVCEEEVHLLRGNHQPCFWETNGPHSGAGFRDTNSFCWLLEEDDCDAPLNMQWQKENCHLFEDRQ